MDAVEYIEGGSQHGTNMPKGPSGQLRSQQNHTATASEELSLPEELQHDHLFESRETIERKAKASEAP